MNLKLLYSDFRHLTHESKRSISQERKRDGGKKECLLRRSPDRPTDISGELSKTTIAVTEEWPCYESLNELSSALRGHHLTQFAEFQYKVARLRSASLSNCDVRRLYFAPQNMCHVNEVPRISREERFPSTLCSNARKAIVIKLYNRTMTVPDTVSLIKMYPLISKTKFNPTSFLT